MSHDKPFHFDGRKDDGVKAGSHTPSAWGEQKLPSSGLGANEMISAEPVVRAEFKPSVRLRPHLNDVLGEFHHTILGQMIHLREKLDSGEPLTNQEVGQLAKLGDTLAKIDRTEREREKLSNPADKDTKELLEGLEAVKAALTDE